MPETFDAQIRARLNADVQAAWPSLRAVHNGPPRLPKDASGYPYVSIALADMTADIEGIRAQVQSYRYEITYVARMPTGQTVEDEKAQLANLLIDRLTQGSARFGPVRRRLPVTISFAPEIESEWEEPLFGFTVSIAFEASERY